MNMPSNNFRIAPDLIWRLLDGNAVVVTPRAGEVRVLNRMGTIIWQQIVEGRSPNDVEDYIVDHFQVSRWQAQKDLTQFLADLADRGVLLLGADDVS